MVSKRLAITAVSRGGCCGFSKAKELFQISMGILFLSSNPKVKMFTLRDNINFIVCIIFIPKSRASTELADRVALVLENALSGKVVGALQYAQSKAPTSVRLSVHRAQMKDVGCLLLTE